MNRSGYKFIIGIDTYCSVALLFGQVAGSGVLVGPSVVKATELRGRTLV
jgi:hypothetical protein